MSWSRAPRSSLFSFDDSFYNDEGTASESLSRIIAPRMGGQSSTASDIIQENPMDENEGDDTVSDPERSKWFEEVDSFDEKNGGMRFCLNELQTLREKLEELEETKTKAARTSPYRTSQYASNRYPSDCYSLIALNGPNASKWPMKKILFFGLGLLVVVLQLSFLGLTIASRVLPSVGDVDTDNPGTRGNGYKAGSWMTNFVPANSSYIAMVSQFLSLLVYVVFPESSVDDIVQALHFFPLSSKARHEDPVWCMRIACCLRAIQGIVASFTVFIVVITTDTVLDIFLNFAALNFISKIDDAFFGLARSGVFGPGLEAETSRIQNLVLPACMQHHSHHVCYRFTMCAMALVLFPLMLFVTVCQMSPDLWVTQSFRMELTQEEFRNFSGCYEINLGMLRYTKRYSYDSFDTGSNVSLGYCSKNRRWILHHGDSYDDPCKSKTFGIEIASSAATNDFDISSSFGVSWRSSSGTPLQLFFESDENKLYCDLHVGDGICDAAFNEPGHAHDGGDCCSATCIGSRCGKGGLQSVFGNPNVSGVGFPSCKAPNMVNVTIHLNNITSSRESVDTTGWAFAQSEIEWRNEPPQPTYFAIECNGKPVMTVFIDGSMVNKTETIQVEDGSVCDVVVKNETKTVDRSKTFLKDYPQIAGSDIGSTQPIWYIDYTINHGQDNSIENEGVEILREESSHEGNVNFRLLPTCFFEELRNYTNTSRLYGMKAIQLLVTASGASPQCGEDDFLDRYALIPLNVSFGDSARKLCNLPFIDCNEGRVNRLNLQNEGLGNIPSEIGLLTELETFDICE